MKLTLWGPALVAGALGALAVVGGTLVLADEADIPNPISLGDDPQESDAAISRDEAITIARANAEGNLGEIELDREGGVLAWEVEVGRNDLVIDANSGAVLRNTPDDDDDGGFDDDNQVALPGNAISAQEAADIARTAATGAVDSVEVETFNGAAAWKVEVGETDVYIDAVSGEVLATELDD